MEHSKILDRIVEEAIELEVSALSVDRRKPLSLKGALIDYDSEGYLFKGRKSGDSPENTFYIPKSAVAHFRVAGEILPLKAQATPSQDVAVYSIHDVTYNIMSHEMILGKKRKIISGDRTNYDLALLFRAGLNNLVPQQSFEIQSEGKELHKNLRFNLKSRVCQLRKHLREFGLDVVAVAGKGYMLREHYQ